MLIFHLYYYLGHFVAFLQTLHNISPMNFVKQTDNLHFFRVSLNTWWTYLAQTALLRILAVGIPTDVNFSQ